ncbi:putative phosphatidylglycerol specific phospholipase [Aspergillus steynii IBT 23096]|uniref:Putative phosphatidylglycerol specific phospholipase n=1 Tax=Aspergillus steynii IBT 23096 TaxID=1392250 RepID=A0A2I2FRZ3_9EURO|nr:putative phosphatidylglycerol specific phospholipase [Aspergillus steynii IBT 23096]PLB43408.1 putative phosphatidylglycerol specific phospholipase [Aspergillus steynii IBT 23096]
MQWDQSAGTRGTEDPEKLPMLKHLAPDDPVTPHALLGIKTPFWEPRTPASTISWRKSVCITLLLLAMSILSLVTFFSLGVGISGLPHGPAPSAQSPIKNVVVLVQENLSFDVFAGGLTYSDAIDGLVKTKYCNPANVTDPTSEKVCAQPVAKNVAPDDPDHSISGGNQQVYGTYHPNYKNDVPDMQGFVTEQIASYGLHTDLSRAAEVINYYTPDNVPVFSAIAENFVLFDRWFASVPGPTNPNRAYLTSGTSHGHGTNDDDFLTSSLPQVSIFEQLSNANISWVNYQNTTGSGFLPDAQFYKWTAQSGKDKTNVQPLDRFFADAKSGSLPQFTWINPECCSYMSFHPPSPINMGEGFVKSIYEAVRSSPQWNETLFILTFDEHGGFADHVAPPENVPSGDNLTYSEKAKDGRSTTFHFDRLGVRVPTVLISPWVGKGLVQNSPSDQSGEFTHTSILKYLAELWNLPVLGPRVEWSPNFKSLITNSFRDDTPQTLPSPATF